MNLTDRGLGAVLGGLRRLAGLDLLDRLGARDRVERLVHAAAKQGYGAVGAANRNFAAVGTRLSGAMRQEPARPKPLFDVTPTDEQQMLQEAFGDFGAKHLRPAALAADAAAAPPEELLAGSRELGLMMLGVPAELGGVVDERSSVTTVLAVEALATGDLGLAAACLAPASVATALSLWGSAEQQGTYLPSLLGDQPPHAAIATLEPRALFDPFELRTTAQREGDHLVLDGTKSLVPLATSAELFLVAAHVEGSGPALVIVESGTDGVRVAAEPAMGVRAAATGTVVLDGVRVPATAVVGDGSHATYAEHVQRARLAWCALTVGTAQAVLDYVIPYVNSRSAFGEPVSHRQAVAFAVADIGVELEGMRLLTYRAASLADQGRDFARATAVARTLCADKGRQIGSEGVQLLGGHGYVKEHPVERWYRDLCATGLMEGALLV